MAGAVAPEAVTVFSLVDLGPAQQDSAHLVAALQAAWPGAQLTVPQLLRPDLGGLALERLGAERLPLYQFLMQKGL